MSYVSRGRRLSGVTNPGADGLYSGPRYPRVEENPDGTRSIAWNQYQVTTSVPVKEDPVGGTGIRPRYWPGIVERDGSWYFAPAGGRAYQGFGPEGIRLSPVDIMMLPDVLKPDVNNDPSAYEYGGGWTPPEPDPEPECVFSGSASFYFDPETYQAIQARKAAGQPYADVLQDARYVQGPTPGDPDSGHPSVPLLPGGGGDTPGYRAGTPSNPYRPWADPSNPFYGCATAGPVVAPRLPETYDPWEDVPPVVDRDPVDDGEPPLSDPSGPYDPVDGPLDDPAGEDDGGPVDRGDREPAGPTGDPDGPPPDLPGDDGGGTLPPGGGGAAGGVNVGLGLGVLLVILLAARERK